MASPSSSPIRSPAADFLTPRTKLARELEAIENASTPSPKRLRSAEKQQNIAAERASNPFLDDSDGDSPSQPRPASGKKADRSSDEESIRGATRPRGGAARRMLAAQADGSPLGRLSVGSKAGSSNSKITDTNDQDELYDTTPVRKRLVRRPMASPSPASVHSPGLFVSPAKSIHDDSDEELPAAPTGSRLAELVAKNRAARQAKEAEEKVRKERAGSAHASSDAPGDEIESSQHVPDENAERILSDAVKPTRKASKKALLEMERETQRMSRQMALAHQMKVKRKFTLGDFAKKFQKSVPEATVNGSGDTTSSSAPNSDGIEPAAKEPVSTPPSSPPTPLDRQRALVEHGALSKMKPVREDTLTSLKSMVSDDEEELPDLAQILSSASKKREQAATAAPQETPVKQDLKLKKRDKTTTKPIVLDDSDSDLEIIAPLPHHLRAFDHVRPSITKFTTDSKAIHNLKHLSALGAYVSKPGKKGTKPSIPPAQLELQLRRKAREQARQQQAERLEELRAKGIVVQTEEEREKEREQFEDLLEKARDEAEGLRKAEKAARKEAGEKVEVSSDEDEDYVGSGSEEDDEMGGGGEAEGLIDEAAEESGEEEEDDDDEEVEVLEYAGDESVEQASQADEPTQLGHTATTTPAPKRARKSRVIEDDEDNSNLEVEDEVAPHAPVVAAADEDPFAAFGFGNDPNNDLMSPAQAFQATMQTPTQDIQQDSMALYRQLPPPSTSSLPPTMPEQTFDDTQEDSQMDIVHGSQAEESQPFQLNWETQAPKTPGPALGRGVPGLSETPGWEPTQDPGVQSPWAARQIRSESTLNSIVEDTEDHETQSTVRVRISESPVPVPNTPEAAVPKRGRLSRRKAIAADESEDEDEVAVPQPTKESVKQSDAFREMARRRAEALTAAERAEAAREMKGMLEEQAEESEDEYAGLGGDDFVAPETAEDAAMIDSSEVQVDERALAAHFAERQRAQDEEQTSKLFKDLTTGGLRRRQAGAWDLDEDEDEVAVRRRQMRQREEARKRKLLLQDGDLDGLVKEGGRGSKGKEAFLKAIADDDGDDELVDLSDDGVDEDGTTAEVDDSQPSQQPDASMPLQETTGNKRRASSPHPSAARPPATKRRTAAAAGPSANPLSRPTSLLQIQDSLSFLLDEPQHAQLSGPTVLDISSESESDASDDEFAAAGGAELELTLAEAEDAADIAAEHERSNDGGFAPDRTAESERARAMMPPPRAPASQRRTKAAVVDRLSLRREASSNNSSTGSVSGKPNAWASTGSNAAHKTPSLLRRATTSATSLTNDRGVSTSNAALRREGSTGSAGAGGGGGVTKKGSKKSSLAYQARAEERKGIVEAGARRRREEMERLAGLRREGRAGGLAGGLGGRFE